MLSEEQIDRQIHQHIDPVATYRKLHTFARAVEAEARRQDTELIRQMLEAIEAETSDTWECNSYHPKLYAAITAARARLEPKP